MPEYRDVFRGLNVDYGADTGGKKVKIVHTQQKKRDSYLSN
jgi:hypothetical protein